MTHLEAIQSYIEPYEVSEGKLELLLQRQGLQPTATHDAQRDFVQIGRAVLGALRTLLSLKKEKDNGSEIDYDIDGLKACIKDWENQIGEPSSSKPQNEDMTARW